MKIDDLKKIAAILEQSGVSKDKIVDWTLVIGDKLDKPPKGKGWRKISLAEYENLLFAKEP